MSDTIIKVENLSKRYIIHHKQNGSYSTLRDAIAEKASRLGKRVAELVNGGRGGKRLSPKEELWALKDVSFEVKRGEVLGIIGRNGAGKSTLLKILSRITEPTEGRVILKGRVGSLLEVGTGFHPELTGRENIYLNGAILGMSKKEIDRKFDEIVDFAEIEKFLDTPVKRYSSGMYVRLAFAVAAHLEPEILLVDEVLAVGDAAFQKKCLGKVGDVAKEGRTVLFVSHNMAAIEKLTRRSIWIDTGAIKFLGNTIKAIHNYLHNSTSALALKNQRLDGGYYIKNVAVRSDSTKENNIVLMGEAAHIEIILENTLIDERTGVGFLIKDENGTVITASNTFMQPPMSYTDKFTRQKLLYVIPRLMLSPGTYFIDVSLAQRNIKRIEYIERSAKFIVRERDIFNNGYRWSRYFGYFAIDGYWKVSKVD